MFHDFIVFHDFTWTYCKMANPLCDEFFIVDVIYHLSCPYHSIFFQIFLNFEMGLFKCFNLSGICIVFKKFHMLRYLVLKFASFLVFWSNLPFWRFFFNVEIRCVNSDNSFFKSHTNIKVVAMVVATLLWYYLVCDSPPSEIP